MRTLVFLILVVFISSAAHAQQIESMTLEGGPIWTRHFQSGDENFKDHHGLAIAKVSTKDYGNWGLYYLNPNSVGDPSIGAGYVTDPYAIPLGPTTLELSAALGLVTGYQDYPVPLIAGQARLTIYENGPLNIGASMAVLPYIAEDPRDGDNDFGIVGTTPFLSVRYKLQP